jgi:hypothetical protein
MRGHFQLGALGGRSSHAAHEPAYVRAAHLAGGCAAPTSAVPRGRAASPRASSAPANRKPSPQDQRKESAPCYSQFWDLAAPPCRHQKRGELFGPVARPKDGQTPSCMGVRGGLRKCVPRVTLTARRPTFEGGFVPSGHRLSALCRVAWRVAKPSPPQHSLPWGTQLYPCDRTHAVSRMMHTI